MQVTQLCAALPYTAVTFGTPYTQTSGASNSALSDTYKYGDYIGKVGFQSYRPTPNEVDISVGFSESSSDGSKGRKLMKIPDFDHLLRMRANKHLF